MPKPDDKPRYGKDDGLPHYKGGKRGGCLLALVSIGYAIWKGVRNVR